MQRGAPSSRRRPSAGSAGWRTRRCSRASGSTTSRATTGCSPVTAPASTAHSDVPGGGPWRVCPSDRGAWPQGSAYYGFDTVYDSSSLGYAGPGFGFSSMPDQYALKAFSACELGAGRRRRSWRRSTSRRVTGHGRRCPACFPGTAWGTARCSSASTVGPSPPRHLWSHRDRVPAAYMTSIAYSLTALISFVERYGDDYLVLVLLGDHQPATIVSGSVETMTCPSP